MNIWEGRIFTDYSICFEVVLSFFFFFIFYVELENRLLARFDAASQRRELSTMAECAKILSQVATFSRPHK